MVEAWGGKAWGGGKDERGGGREAGRMIGGAGRMND